MEEATREKKRKAGRNYLLLGLMFSAIPATGILYSLGTGSEGVRFGTLGVIFMVAGPLLVISGIVKMVRYRR